MEGIGGDTVEEFCSCIGVGLEKVGDDLEVVLKVGQVDALVFVQQRRL